MKLKYVYFQYEDDQGRVCWKSYNKNAFEAVMRIHAEDHFKVYNPI